MHSAWIEVNLENIRKNIRYLKKRKTPNARFLGVIKANGYGHGAIEVARILEQEGAWGFAVANSTEGLELRNAGFTQPILVLGHCFPHDFEKVIPCNLTLTISSLEDALEINSFARSKNRKIKAHIKIDTGMGRLGIIADENTVDIVRQILYLAHIDIEGIFSHLATGGQIEDTSYCDKQFGKFATVLCQLERIGIEIPIKHLSNSGATILFPHTHLDMVRPGTSMYGLYASEELVAFQNGENYPAMEIKAQLANIKTVPANTYVSYSCSFHTEKPSVLGVVPMGYVDGIFRCLANNGEVLLHGERCKMVGNICMDQFVIDISSIENPQIGDEIVILGRQGNEFISAEELGRKCGTISIEVLCGLGKRIPIVYK